MEEYNQFRDNVTAYIRFTATNLLNVARSREEKRMSTEIGLYIQHNKTSKEESEK